MAHPGLTTMTHRNPLIPAVAILLFVAPGCATYTNPNVSQRTRAFVAAQDAYSGVLFGAAAVRGMGRMSDADAAKVERARAAAALALDAYRANAAGESDWRAAYARLLTALAEIGRRDEVGRHARGRPKPRGPEDDAAALAASDAFRAQAEAAWRAVGPG